MKTINTLTVYLGSSGHCRQIFQDATRELGKIIADAGKNLVYGGMDAGLMGALAQSALNHGAHVTGIIPTKLKDSERILKNLSETILVEEMCERKKLMFLKADAILALPGGYGTVDETLEVLYWGNLGMHDKPVVLINIDGYWDDFIAYIETLPDFDPRYLITVSTLDEIMPALQNWQAPEIDKIDHLHYPHFEDEIGRKTNQPIIVDIASVENSYFAVSALGLKQLAKHDRNIGLLNTNGQFDKLQTWIDTAAKERFITEKCKKLFIIDNDEETLRKRLKSSTNVKIDLHNEKWGESISD
jgi:uncharacterized protein (TIGR00730 family)